MNALALFLVFLTISLAAESSPAFEGLSTNEDGSVLYFASSFRQKGTDQSFHSKIFRWDQAAGFRVVAEQRDPGVSDGCAESNFYELHSPQVSTDGTVLAFTASRPVTSSRYCPPLEANRGIVRLSGREIALDGNVAISPNGRIAITTPRAAVASEYHVFTDLTSGQRNIVAGAFNGSGQRVANSGAIVEPRTSAVVLTDASGFTRVWPTSRAAEDAILDSSGRTVVYVTRLSPGDAGHITAIDTATGIETTLVTGLSPQQPWLTTDGKTVLYTDTDATGTQLYTVRVDGSGGRRVTNVSGGVPTAILSGNGRIAYATGPSGLVRVDMDSGSVTILAPAPPQVSAVYSFFRETHVAAVGSVLELGGVTAASVKRALFCGQPVQIPDRGPLRFQVPWDQPEGMCGILLESDAPFEFAPVTLQVKQYDPAFGQFVLHEGFTGVVSDASPAAPGELVTVYMTGLGPIETNGGIRPGFRCLFNATMADVEYAGAAPGYSGFYQVNVRLPNVRTRPAILSCGWDEKTQAMIQVPL